MDSLMNIWTWLQNNWGTIATVILAAHGLAIAIVNLTPSDSDNQFLAKIYPWIEKLGGIFTDKAKDPNINQK